MLPRVTRSRGELLSISVLEGISRDKPLSLGPLLTPVSSLKEHGWSCVRQGDNMEARFLTCAHHPLSLPTSVPGLSMNTGAPASSHSDTVPGAALGGQFSDSIKSVIVSPLSGSGEPEPGQHAN